MAQQLADTLPWILQGHRLKGIMVYLLADKLRSRQLDALTIDEEAYDMATEQVLTIASHYGLASKWRDALATVVKVIMSLLTLIKNPNQTIGMSMMQLKLQGDPVKGYLYAAGRAIEQHISNLNPVWRKIVDIFNTASFIVFLGTGQYSICSILIVLF